MNGVTKTELEEKVGQLSLQEQLWLMELLVHQIRRDAQSEDVATNRRQKANGLTGASQTQSTAQTVAIDAAIADTNPISSMSSLWADKAVLKATMREFMRQVGITGSPVGAERLQEMIRHEMRLETNELSRGIIEMREEKLRARGLS